MRLALAAAALAWCGLVQATPYLPQAAVHGDLRITGSPEDAGLVSRWEAGFRKHHPDVHVVASLHGHESSLAGLYTGRTDIAFVGRELREPVDNMAFQWVRLYKPGTVEVAAAGLRADRVASTLGVFVHPDNPIASLTLGQLDAIFGEEHRSAPGIIRHWGELGLGGEWRDRPIDVVAPRVDSVAALFFRRKVLGNSFKWNETLTECEGAPEVVAEVSRDPAAIGFAPMAASFAAKPRAVPIAASRGAPVAPAPATVSDGSYPLARAVIMAFDRAPARPMDPRVREFLRYVLSDEGQAAVADDGAYLPLSPRRVSDQLEKLD